MDPKKELHRKVQAEPKQKLEVAGKRRDLCGIQVRAGFPTASCAETLPINYLVYIMYPCYDNETKFLNSNLACLVATKPTKLPQPETGHQQHRNQRTILSFGLSRCQTVPVVSKTIAGHPTPSIRS